MLNYPITKATTCRYCGAAVTLDRQGNGAPKEGGLNYWYTADHRCAGSEQAIAADQAERRLLDELLYKGA